MPNSNSEEGNYGQTTSHLLGSAVIKPKWLFNLNTTAKKKKIPWIL
jgi:hypothetical protein